ncbi:MAG: hypothetical protein IJD91_05275 [Clostridia bacterium]|nr:hypothetical protein [Clostridia bacterium]
MFLSRAVFIDFKFSWNAKWVKRHASFLRFSVIHAPLTDTPCHPELSLSCHPALSLSCHPALSLSCHPALSLSCHPERSEGTEILQSQCSLRMTSA